MNRRQFMRYTAAVGGVSVAEAAGLVPDVAAMQSSSVRRPASSPAAALDLAEWSYFWLGVDCAQVARGTVCAGTHFYVEYMVPTNVRHQPAIVLVHGGGGQGLDWLTTPGAIRSDSTEIDAARTFG